MIDIVKIRQNPEEIAAALAKKGCEVDFAQLLSWDDERKRRIADIEKLKARRNKVSSEIPRLKKEGKPVDDIFAEMRAIGNEIAEGDAAITALAERITDFLSRLPNLQARQGDRANSHHDYILAKMKP